MPLADTLANPLINAYAEVWDGLVGELGTLTDPGAWRRRERIRELLVTIDKEFKSLTPAVRQFTERDLKDVYGLGHAWGASTAGVQGVFAIQYNETLGALENGLRDRLLAETRGASETMQRQVRAAARTATRSSVAAGTPAQAAARQMAETLRGSGLHSVTYSNGSVRSIKTYSEMAVRTTTAQAYNEGSFQLGSQIGVQFYEVFDGPTCGWTFHEDSDLADGKIVTEDEARAWPISHPNCRRSFGARPDLNEKPDGKVEHRMSPPTSAAEARERARLESGGLLRERRRPGRRSQPGASRAAAGPTEFEELTALGPKARALDPERFAASAPREIRDELEEEWAAAVRETFEFQHKGITSKVEQVRGLPARSGSFEVGMYNEAGDWVGSARRTFFLDADDSIIVRHESLKLQSEYQGQGFSTVLNGRAENLYRQVGAKQVELNANIDVGGYAWAKAGYDWKSPRDFQSVIRWYAQVGDRATLTPDELSKLDRWIELGKARGLESNEGLPTPFDLATFGFREGSDSWFGKQSMLGTSWYGRKPL